MSSRHHPASVVVLLSLCAALAVAAPVREVRPTEGYLPKFSRTVKPAARERVPLVSDFPSDCKAGTWPVTFGVPFPQGALQDAQRVRVITDRGVEVPAQIIRTATWERPDGDVRWVLADMIAQRGTQYVVEYGSGVERREFPSPLRVAETAAGIEVVTGPLRMTFSRERSHLIGGTWLDTDGDGHFAEPERVLQAGSRMSMTDQEGTCFETSDRPEDYEVAVETSGSQRVVVKASGWYRDAAGTGICQYVTRVHLYAGQPFVRILHTFIVVFDTDRTQLRDIAVPFELAHPAASVRFHADDRDFDPAFPSSLVQDAADRFQVKGEDGQVTLTGGRAAGWVALGSTEGGAGIAVSLRNIWQDFPKELEARPDGVVAHLWPLHSDAPLDFRAPAALGPKAYAEMGDRIYWRNWYRGGLDKFDQAMGLAKTNDMLVTFYTGEPHTVASQAHTDPPFLVSDPEWMCRTDVFGPLHPFDPGRFPDIESKYETAFSRYEFLRANIDNYDRIGNYGFFDYGDVNYVVVWDEEKGCWRPRPWRRMASRFYGISLMPWLQYARSGKRRYRRWAIDSARHVMDIDMCHVDGKPEGYPYQKYAGGRFGGNGGIIHYGADVYDIGCDSHVAPWAYAYYMTGDRRAWDVLLEEGEFYVKAVAEGRSGHMRRYAHRMTGGAMRVFIQLWWATWDPRYLELAHRTADFCYEAAKESDGVIRHDDVYMNPGLVTYYQATGDERMRELILRCMREINAVRLPMGDERGYTFYGPAMAYYFTGDPSYLSRSLFWLRQYQEELNVDDDPLQRGIPRGRWDMCHNSLQLTYGPYLLGALTTLDGAEPEPAIDLSATNAGIWFQNPDGRAFDVSLLWRAYVRPTFWGVTVSNWKAYCEKHKPEARIAVHAPDGTVAAAAGMDFAATPNGARVALTVPEGAAGLYRLAIDGPDVAPVKLLLVSTSLEKWGYPVASGSISHAQDCWFRPRPDASEMTARYKILGLRTEQSVRLFDPEGNVVKQAENKLGSMPDSDWSVWSVPVPATARDGLWRVSFAPVNPNVQEVLLRIDGAEPLVSVTPKAFFVPESLPPPPRPPPPVSPPSHSGPVRRVPAGKTWRIPCGEEQGDGGFERVHPDQGTIEFWLRADWDPDDIVDGDILRCGELRLHRRSQIGTYITCKGVSYQAGLVLQPGTWHHLAVAWDFTGAADKRVLRLFVDGVHFGKVAFGSLANMEAWIGESIEIGSLVPLHVCGFQTSAISRHARLAEGALSPVPDEHTLFAQ